MLAPWIIICIIVLVLAFVFYVVRTLVSYLVRRSKHGRFRITVKLLKLLDIDIEVDAQDRPGELPGNQPGQT